MELLISLGVFFWIGFALVTGVAANTRGRSGVAWFLLALLISPLLAIGFLLAVGPKKAAPERVERDDSDLIGNRILRRLRGG
jgi:hypothetical protein